MSKWTTVGVATGNLYSAATSSTKAEVTDDAKSTVYCIHYMNANAAVSYLQIFDLDADDVTVGTTAPTYVLMAPANSEVNFSPPVPIEHSAGFTVASATTATGASNSAGYVTIVYTHSA